MNTLLISAAMLMARPTLATNYNTPSRVEMYATNQRRLAQNRFDLSFGLVEVF